MEFKNIKKVYFIGIGGIGISALAQLMHHEGKIVSGTNDNLSPETLDRVRALGVEINIGADITKIPADVDLVVYSLAWDDREPEFMTKVRALDVPVFSYPQALGLVSVDKFTIAVAGTHGKTTTTAMIAEMMIAAKLDPIVVVGSLLKSGSNFVAGQSNYFVVEACEYRRSFLNLHPTLAIVTNIDNDHLDYYKDLADIKSAFDQFIAQSENQIIDYQKYLTKVPELVVPGEHNRQNAAAALAVADFLKIDEKIAKQTLSKFTGTWRRFEYKGMTGDGALVYDDYAHHPTEVSATIEAARDFMKKRNLPGRLIVAFQPHLYSRTKLLKDEFARVLSQVDELILAPIYAAREQPDLEVNSDILADLIRPKNPQVSSLSELSLVGQKLKEEGKEGDLIITMGAGDIGQVGDNLVEKKV